MYLIQRCTYKNTKISKQVISDIYSQDYMGSAEFEYGAKPASLRAMWAFKEHYQIWIIPENNLYIWGNIENIDTINLELRNYISTSNGTRLKELISLWDILNNKKSYREDNFWWDLENHFVFSLIKKAVSNWPICLKNSIEYMDYSKARCL